MSSIASPRPSISIRSPSSTRTSTDTPRAGSISALNPRRNRAALRDYYGLKASAANTSNNNNRETSPHTRISEESTHSSLTPDPDFDSTTLSELDAPSFDAEAFVQQILSTSGLPGVLQVEADLVSQIRNLDSDRKSLVYDNYSKLLAATSTIRRMRGNMDPLAPTTNTLAPAISHIAETAKGLVEGMHGVPERGAAAGGAGLGLGLEIGGEKGDEDTAEVKKRKEKERDTVRWVLDTPRRLRALIIDDREEEAERDWEEVNRILDKWSNVAGVKELRVLCEDIMNPEESGAE